MTHAGTDGALLSSEQLAAMRTQAQQAIDQLGDDLAYMGIGVPGSMGARDVVRLCDYLTMVHARLAAAERVVEAARDYDVGLSEWWSQYPSESLVVPVQVAVKSVYELRAALAGYDATPRQPGDAGERNAK